MGLALGLVVAALPASAADLAAQFPDLKMPSVMLAASHDSEPAAETTEDATADTGVDGELVTVRRPGFDLADRLTVGNLPAHRDFAAVFEEAKREAMGYKALGTKSVASSLPTANDSSGRTVATFASHSRPHCRSRGNACPPQPCPPGSQTQSLAVPQAQGMPNAVPAPATPDTAVVPLPESMQADATPTPAVPDLSRQLARADVGGLRETWSDAPVLVGDGCAPQGSGGKISVGRLCILSPGMTASGGVLSGSGPATAYQFDSTGPNSITELANAGYPSFDPLPAPVVGSVPGTPPALTIGGASPGAGITPILEPSSIYQTTANDAFINNIPSTAGFANGTAVYDAASSGALPSNPPAGDPQDAFLFYNYVIDGAAALPGFAVGFVKLTENMSPIPRDRVYMNYSYFKNANFYPEKADVNRFMPGFEKTFYDGWTSIEIRTPFAATLGSDQFTDPNMCGGLGGVTEYRDIEFGNMSVIFKTLLMERDTWAITAGVQTMLPTASNTSVTASTNGRPDGTLFQSVFVANESVHVMPFLGAIWAPNERFFNQALLQVERDVNGNLVYVNDTANPGLSGRDLNQIGRVYFPTFMYMSFGTGYWLYKNDQASGLTGFSPVMELHVNQGLNAFQPLKGDTYQIGVSQGIVSVTNALIGCNFEWGTRSTLTFAYVTPLGGGADRFFDGEVRALYNWRFGPQNRLTRAQF
jgi:hypothetical protein